MAESKIGKRGRPSTRDAEGFTEHMRKLLNYKKAHPLASKEEACRETGVALNTFKRYWKNRTNVDELFKQRWRGYEHVLAKGPPDPGTFIEFREKYLNVATENPYTLRRAMVGVTWPYMEPLCEALEDPERRRILTLLPVRHAKTTIAEHYAIYLLCKNPNSRIAIICSTITLARDRLYNIQRVLMSPDLYPELHEKWGPWIGKPDDAKAWTKTACFVRGRTSPERDPSLAAFGVTGKIYGIRADLMILDDCDDPGNMSDVRDSIMRAINGPIVSRLAEGGKMVFIGTRCGQDDIYGRLMQRPGWWTYIRRAIEEDEKGEPRALEPEMYSLEEIELFRQQDMTEVEFQLMYQNNPTGAGDTLFPPELIEAAKARTSQEAPEGWYTIVSLDPARTGVAGIVALAVDPEGRNMRVLDVEAMRNPHHDGLFELVQRFVFRFKPQTVVIEAQGGSAVFSESPQLLRFIRDEVHGQRPLIEFQTGKNKHDPAYGVPLIADQMIKERLKISWGPLDEPAEAMRVQARMKALVDDLLAYRPVFTSNSGRKYDTVMALWFAVRTAVDGIRAQTRRQPLHQAIRDKYRWLAKRPA